MLADDETKETEETPSPNNDKVARGKSREKVKVFTCFVCNQQSKVTVIEDEDDVEVSAFEEVVDDDEEEEMCFACCRAFIAQVKEER